MARVFNSSSTASMSRNNRLKNLENCIVEQNGQEAVKLVKEIEPDVLGKYRYPWPTRADDEQENKEDCTILQLAAANMFNNSEVLVEIVRKCPQLLAYQRKQPYDGQTPLHTLISRGNKVAVEKVLNEVKPVNKKLLLERKCSGCYFENTVMMAQLPLSIAALTFNKDMVQLLLKNKAEFRTQNDNGDTVFHSLVRYSHCFPEKEELAVDMMKFLHEKLQKSIRKGRLTEDAFWSTWMIENKKEGFTALKLAAALARSKIFDFIFHLKGVYCRWGGASDGLFNHFVFDVTEIDSAASICLAKETRDAQKKASRDDKNRVEPINEDAVKETPWKFSQRHKAVSVFEILSSTAKARYTSEILLMPIMKSVIQRKWDRYFKYFISWGLAHLVFMVLLSAYAVAKARETSACLDEDAAPSLTDKSPWMEGLVIASFAPPLVIITVIIRYVWTAEVFVRLRTEKWRLLFRAEKARWLLFLFAVCLLIDSIWYWIGCNANNYFLIAAILFGWLFMTFFLRPFRKFAFFTTMLRKVLTGDLFRFSSIILLMLVAFSVAMHAAFSMTSGATHESFSTFWRSLMTMFKLMLGLEEMGMLYEAPEPWFAISLFALYVLLAYVVMMNALIALMSNTCSAVTDKRDSNYMHQLLSVLLMIEGFLPECCIHVECSFTDRAESGTRYLYEIRSISPMDMSKDNKQAADENLKNLLLTTAFTRSIHNAEKGNNVYNLQRLTDTFRLTPRPDDTHQKKDAAVNTDRNGILRGAKKKVRTTSQSQSPKETPRKKVIRSRSLDSVHHQTSRAHPDYRSIPFYLTTVNLHDTI